MKRITFVLGLLFVLGVHYKLTGTGPALSWVEVFLPLILEGVWWILVAVDALFNITAGIRFRILKPIIMWRYQRDIKKAHEALKKQGGRVL
jgi:hypothetical protein